MPDSVAATKGYAVSQQNCKLIDESFDGQVDRPESAGEGAGLDRVNKHFVQTMAAFNLIRMRTLGQIRCL